MIIDYEGNSIIVYSTSLSSSEEPLNKLSINSFVKDEDVFIFNLPDDFNDYNINLISESPIISKINYNDEVYSKIQEKINDISEIKEKTNYKALQYLESYNKNTDKIKENYSKYCIKLM